MTETVSWPRRVWQAVYWRREHRLIRQRYQDTRHLVYFGGDGIGDELLCSAPLHALRERRVSGIGVMTSRPELFAHSLDTDAVYAMRHDDLGFLRQVGVRLSQTTYIREHRTPDIDVPPQLPIIAEMCRLCGIHGSVTLRPYLWLTLDEKAEGRAYQGCIAVQSSRQSASLGMGNKEWLPSRFQEVVTTLSQKYRVVQLGLPSDPLLAGAEDLRGRMDLRQTAAVLSNARIFVGLVGFLMHLARAVDCRSVIVYGGREHPEQSGYICNENLYTALPCSPCWRWNTCDYQHKCMTEIQAADVLAAVHRLLGRPRDRLEVQQVTLT